MLLRSLIIILTPFLLYVSKSLATEAPELEVLQKRLLLLEKEILDLKMKNVVEDKFEWQFLKMTEIENDIKKLHNRFEILENNYYKELKNLKASTVGMFIYLQPVIGILFAIYRGADKLTVADITSVILVFAGVYLVSKRSTQIT